MLTEDEKYSSEQPEPANVVGNDGLCPFCREYYPIIDRKVKGRVLTLIFECELDGRYTHVVDLK